MNKKTKDWIAANRAEGRKCCPTTTMSAYDAFMDVLDEAQNEARSMRRQFRRLRDETTDHAALGELGELYEKYGAVEYHTRQMEGQVELLQQILIEIRDATPRILNAAEAKDGT